MTKPLGEVSRRSFTGRITSMQELSDAMSSKAMEEYTVMHFYGIGGIGKTRLQKEMRTGMETNNRDVIIGHLNFEASHLRHAQGALAELREQIKHTYKVQFTWYDLACAVLWKKVNPTITFKSNQKELPFLDESSYITELVSLVDTLPFVQWVPKTLQFMQSVSSQIQRFRLSTDELSMLIKELVALEPFEIEERLPFFLAEDIRVFLKKHPKRPVIFIDTYEALSTSSRHQNNVIDNEGWIKELILQLPEVLWVSFGREKLEWQQEHSDWNKIVRQTQIYPFTEEEAEDFLQKAGIDDLEIREKMIKVSAGLPYHLELNVDTFELIQQKRLPQMEDFSTSSTQIVERLLRYLSLPERELLKVLSFPQQWNERLFKQLITSFSIGYPATAISEISRFSFILKKEAGEWEMHPIMRRNFQRLMKERDYSLYENVHQHLFKEYERMLLKSSYSQKQLNNMIYHATKFDMTSADEKSLVTVINLFYKAGYYTIFTPLGSDFQFVMDAVNDSLIKAELEAINGYVASDQGRLDDALAYFDRAQEFLAKVSRSEHDHYDLSVRIKREAASIHIKRTSYARARQLLLEAIELNPPKGKRNVALVYALLQLGKLENDSLNKEQAGMCYEKGFDIILDMIAENSNDIEVLCLNGILYEKKGEWLTSKHLVEQALAYTHAVEYLDHAHSLRGELPLELEVARGLAWKRRAENFSKQEGFEEETISAFQKAIAIYDNLLVVNSEFVEALVKKGHAAVDYLAFLGKCKRFSEAEAVFDMAIESFSSAIEKSVDQAAAHNRLASAYREMAIIYKQMGEKELSVSTFAKALEENRQLSHSYPNYMHAASTLKKIQAAMDLEGGLTGI